ncbi:MAG TPA: efflux RND transporter periplasmic adaptor subunit [Pyrinomonadaceae bacterium]|nr:efflux RND transporter periplasmic adaptor subunit [Pyrinomonadaceae bacterium]
MLRAIGPLVKLKNNVKLLLPLMLLALIATAACKSDYPASARQNRAGDKPREVRTARVEETPFGEAVSVNGTLAAYDETVASAKVPGRLRAISVDLGTVVRRGQVIAQVEPQDYNLRVQQAEAALAQARARVGLSPDGRDDRVTPEQTGTVRQARAVLDEARVSRDRSARLVEQGIVARSEFDTVDANYKVAVSRYQDAIEEIRNRQALVAQRRSELALAKQQLADTAVHAPLDGVIQEKRASVGEYLAAGAPVVNIVKMDPLRLRAEVPEREATAIRAGQNVRVTVDGNANVYVGQITRLSPVIAQQTRMLVVEADVRNNGGLRPGAFARAEIVTNDAKMAVTVPNSALVTFAGIEKVIVVQNGKAIEKPVTTGRRNGEWTEIVAGVSVGDQVVVDPGNLQNGMAVEVVQ